MGDLGRDRCSGLLVFRPIVWSHAINRRDYFGGSHDDNLFLLYENIILAIRGLIVGKDNLVLVSD